MDKFEELVKQGKETFEPNVEGCFDCQVCDVTVEEAYYDHVSYMLVWKCPSGHISRLKEFSL